MNFSLTEHEKQILLEGARETVQAYLKGTPPPEITKTENLQTKCGAFVTIRKNGALQGCIGHMTGVRPLTETIRDLAVSSAFRDPRFPPLSEDELDDITIEITVLTPLEEINDVTEIEVGRHGIYLEKGGRSGVLLPQVATERGWDRETFLDHTCMKAGLTDGCWRTGDVKISIFEGIIFQETG